MEILMRPVLSIRNGQTARSNLRPHPRQRFQSRIWSGLGENFALDLPDRPPLGHEPEIAGALVQAPAALFDLGIIGALLWLLRLRGLPSDRVLIYAWSPLPIWEFWGEWPQRCHGCILPDRGARLGRLSTLVYWLRMLSGSQLLRNGGRRCFCPRSPGHSEAFARICSRPLWSGGLILLYATDATENAQFMSGFVGGWRNNDSLFGAILYLMGDLYRAKYLTFALIGAVALWLAIREWPLERIALWTIVVAVAAFGELSSLVSHLDRSPSGFLPAPVSAAVGGARAAGAFCPNRLANLRRMEWIDTRAMVDLCSGLRRLSA